MLAEQVPSKQILNVLNRILQFPDKKLQRVLDLGRLFRFSTNAVEQEEILSVLAEVLMQDAGISLALNAVAAKEPVDIESERKVLSYRKRVGQCIREFRQQRGMTQPQLAQKSGLPQPHICRLEKGQHAATPETIRRIAEALNVAMGEIDPAFS